MTRMEINHEFAVNIERERIRLNLTQKDMDLQIRQTFYNVTHHGKVYMKFGPHSETTNLKEHKKGERDIYDAYSQTPAPNHYWKVPKGAESVHPSKLNLAVIEDDNGNKIYYMDRRKTDKRVYSAGMRKAVY